MSEVHHFAFPAVAVHTAVRELHATGCGDMVDANFDAVETALPAAAVQTFNKYRFVTLAVPDSNGNVGGVLVFFNGRAMPDIENTIDDFIMSDDDTQCALVVLQARSKVCHGMRRESRQVSLPRERGVHGDRAGGGGVAVRVGAARASCPRGVSPSCAAPEEGVPAR